MARTRRKVRLAVTGRGALRRAEGLLEAGRNAEAAKLMVTTHLGREDPRTAEPHEDLIDAAGWYVQAVNANPRAVPDPLAWALFAYRAAHQLQTVSPDLSVLQVGVDALVHALHEAGRHEEGTEKRRESVQVAAGRGDAAGARLRRLSLVSELHLIGRCGEAAEEGLDTVEALLGTDGTAADDRTTQIIAAVWQLESCHQHDDATALAARLGLDPDGLTVIAKLAFEPEVRPLLEVLAPGFLAHAAQYHGAVRCDRLDCPVALDRAAGLRLYAGLLSRHDPATAEPDVALARVAMRFAAFADADTQRIASAPDWAQYAHRAVLALPGTTGEEIGAAAMLALAHLGNAISSKNPT